MKILKIEATRENILIYADFSGAVTVSETVATVGPSAPKELSRTETFSKDGVICLSREGLENRDRIYSRFRVFVGDEAVEGVCYVTDFAPDVPENTMPYPQPEIIKTLAAPSFLYKELNIQQGLLNINLPHLMSAVETEETMPYEFNGKTYYFYRSAVAGVDDAIQSVPVTTMILLNSANGYCSRQEKALLDKVIHPGFDWDFPSAFISAFNTETEEGLNYYGAFVEFLVERYTRPDGKYGRVSGAIISNEINTQYIWGNAGEMPVSDYMEEYTQAMRLAWICGQKHCSHFRVFISLDHFWTGVNFNASEPLRYYSGRETVELLTENSLRDGNFEWGIAHHPYPEDLNCPDFWNDRCPTFALDTYRITFKNIEVLKAYLAQEKLLYRGKSRRVLFSEQGFNSQNGHFKEITEKQAAAAYVLAYMKSRNLGIVDMMTHHGCVDNPHEFGLNLGIYRFDPTKPGGLGEPKPILESFLAMDTPDEPAAVAKARAFIGEELFDLVLNPPEVTGDLNKENVLGNA
ncbi:MAG: hypothetical protein IKZ19_08235 [Clostridia bacterium]|nr:hypothetical protein [Clostridia bacterium]